MSGKYQRVSAGGEPFGIELALVSEEVTAAYERAIAAGAIALSSPKEKPWGQMVAYVRATEGTLIEICSPIA
ncbi:MAG: hypothetical protein WBB01_23435 [Phormidesmis sp.]